MMKELLLTVLNMSISGGIVIIAILLARLILKKAPKKWSYLLWGAAAFRLCCPVSIKSAISLFSLVPKAPENAEKAASAAGMLEYIPSIVRPTPAPISLTTPLPDITPLPQITSTATVTGIPTATATSIQASTVTSIPEAISPVTAAPTPTTGVIAGITENIGGAGGAGSTVQAASVSLVQALMTAAVVLWIVGMIALIAYSVIGYIKIYRKMSAAVRLEGNIYQSELVRSPFILGFIRPKIYIPFGLSPEAQSYVLAHEKYHLKRGDHIIKVFSFLLLALHWFNPLCWLAFYLSNKDMELSCDEKVLGDQLDIRRQYSTTLLSFAVGKQFPSASPLAFGESGVRSRIKNAMNYKKPKFIVTVIALVLSLAVLAACIANPNDSIITPGPQEANASAQPTAEPTAEPTEVPTAEPREYYTVDETDLMKLTWLEYGNDFTSLYEKYGKSVTINEVFEDENGMPCIVRDGVVYHLGLDFLSMAMVYNTNDPSGTYANEDEVYDAWWRYFVIRFNHLLPELPLYCTEYHNVYNSMIKGTEEHPVNPYSSTVKALTYWSSEKPENDIIIGNAAELTGCFRVPDFGKSKAEASDADISDLVNGLEIFSMTEDGSFVVNETAVKNLEQIIDEDGNKEFRITIHDDLKFSDGSPITALDYIAQPLASLTPVYTQAAWREISGRSILGWEGQFQFYAGPGSAEGKKELAGIRLYDEHTFGFILDGKIEAGYYFDFLFKFPLYAIPKELFIEDCEIRDDGNGCYLSDDFYQRDGDTYLKAQFIRDQGGYATESEHTGSRWSGPYAVKEYDKNTHTAVLVRNPYFKGNYEGVKPQIEKIIYKKINPDTVLEDLKTGKLDVGSDFGLTEDVSKALDAVEASEGKLYYTHYTAARYGKLAFRCDYGPVQFAAVRRAIAYCMDRKQLANDMNAGSGTVVDGPYQTDMRMYKSAIENGMSLNSYELSLEAAIECLEEDGWVYNADGSAYSGSGVRYKRIPEDRISEDDKAYHSLDDTYQTVKVGEYYYMPLVLNWCGSTENVFTDMLVPALADNANIEAAGMKVYHNELYYSSMLDEFYQQWCYGYSYGHDHGYGHIHNPKYCVFNFARALPKPRYDYSWQYTVDQGMYADYSACYIKDTADIVFNGNIEEKLEYAHNVSERYIAIEAAGEFYDINDYSDVSIVNESIAPNGERMYLVHIPAERLRFNSDYGYVLVSGGRVIGTFSDPTALMGESGMNGAIETAREYLLAAGYSEAASLSSLRLTIASENEDGTIRFFVSFNSPPFYVAVENGTVLYTSPDLGTVDGYLRLLYPRYFGLRSDALAVYITKSHDNDGYLCRLLDENSSSNPVEDFSGLPRISLDEMKIILSTYDVDRDSIKVYIPEQWEDMRQLIMSELFY